MELDADKTDVLVAGKVPECLQSIVEVLLSKALDLQMLIGPWSKLMSHPGVDPALARYIPSL